MLKLKICGATNPENIKELSSIKPDMIGLIFYSFSKRDISSKTASDICHAISPNIKRVGVFVDLEAPLVEFIIAEYKLDFIQLYHNDISDFQYLRTKVQIIKAISILKEIDLLSTIKYESQSDLFLFDTKGDKPGGNGFKFDWRILQKYKGKTPFMLSGGISPEDVNHVKQFNHQQLYGIDINSKFEIEPGIKNINTVKEFKTKLYENNKYH